MKIFGIKIAGVAAACLLGLAGLMQPGQALAQATGSIHGKVINPAGTPVTQGEVRLTTDKSPGPASSKKYDYTFPLNANGEYKGDGIKPGTYVGVAFQGPVSADFIMSLPIVAGQDKEANFDMSRKEYLDKMSPEEKANLEEVKKQNAAAMAANAKISNLNALLKQAREDTKAGKYDSAIKEMTDATAAKPDEALLWDTLGDAQLGDAVASEKAAKQAKAVDASVPGKYAAAITSYQKAITLNAAAAKPNPELAATVNNQLGQALGKTGKTKEAADAYEAAAKAQPANSGMYYYNEAVTLYNAAYSSGDQAAGMASAAAADKAVAADPKKIDAYYLKTKALALSVTTKSGDKPGAPDVVVVPPGLTDAANKYIQSAPPGPQVDEIKGLLQSLNEPIPTSVSNKPSKR